MLETSETMGAQSFGQYFTHRERLSFLTGPLRFAICATNSAKGKLFFPQAYIFVNPINYTAQK